MHYSVETSVAPPAEPVTLAEAKAHLRVDASDDDDLIEGLILGAREWVENYTRRSFVQRTLVMRMDGFPAVIRLPRGPVASVTSVQCVDVDGNTSAFGSSNYQTDLYAVPARICLVTGATWPTVKVGQINAVLITYVAGYAPSSDSPTDYAANVPGAVKAAMKLLIAHWHENRELVAPMAMNEVPWTVKALLAPFEVRDFTLE